MREIVKGIGIFLFFQSFLFGTTYQEDISKLEKLKLSYEYIHANDGTKLYYVKQLLHKTNDDASGIVAKFDIKYKNIRKTFYKKIIYKLIEESSAKENYGASLEIYKKIEGIGNSVFKHGGSTVGNFSKILKLLDEANNDNVYKIIRKNYLGWSNHATLKNVKNRLGKLSDSLKTLSTDIKITQATLAINHDVMQLFIISSIDTGILLDKIEFLQTIDSKKDSALTEVLLEISTEIKTRNDGMMSKGISIIKGMYNRGESKVIDFGLDFTKTYIVGQIASLAFNSTGAGMIFTLGVGELVHEFYSAPNLLKEHILISSLLINSFESDPLYKEALTQAFTRIYQYENQDSYKQYQKDKITIFLFSLFYKNMNVIASDRGWTEALNGGVLFMFYEKYLDRDKVKEVSKSLDNHLQDRFVNVILESKYDIDISTDFLNSKCYLPKAPLDVGLVVKVKENDVSTNDFKVTWLVKNSKDYFPTIYTNSKFHVSKGGTYYITPIIFIKDKHQVIGDTQIVIVKNSNITINSIKLLNKGKYNLPININNGNDFISRFTPVFAFYSDGKSQYINGCAELTFSVKDTSIIDIILKNYLSPKKEGKTKIIAKLLNYTDSSDIYVFNKFRDVFREQWFSCYVEYLSDKKIVNGYPNFEFKPDQPITRAEFIKMLITAYEKINSKVVISHTAYLNSGNNPWFSNYLNKANEIHKLPWSKNSEEESFFNKDISRGEVVKILQYYSFKSENPNIKNFTDISSINDNEMKQGIIKLHQQGIIKGYGNSSSFGAKNLINRAEVSKIIIKIFYPKECN